MALAHRRTWSAESQPAARRLPRSQCEGLVLAVPPGTLVIDAEEGHTIKDLVQAGDQIVIARGGKGGKGNIRFKTSTNQAPRESTPGGPSEVRTILLELKAIADVGLIGKPNAGKSTLLSRLSRARPEIADYPFTTKTPNLGQVTIDFEHSFIMADIPGLIEGAHQGAGLGHEFLRHIERAGILVHLVEPLPMDGTDPVENYRAVRHEFGEYNAALLERPEIVCVTKSELPNAEEIRLQLTVATGRDVLAISSVTGQGLNTLVQAIVRVLYRQEEEG